MGWFKLGWETGKTAIKKGPEVIKAVKALAKTGAESVASWKAKAAKAKLKMAKENLEQTFKKTDESLKKFGKTVKKQKKILED